MILDVIKIKKLLNNPFSLSLALSSAYELMRMKRYLTPSHALHVGQVKLASGREQPLCDDLLNGGGGGGGGGGLAWPPLCNNLWFAFFHIFFLHFHK